MSTEPHAPKAYIACDRCKQRKKKCDGVLPKCALCANQGWDCHYASERRVRGLGKKDKQGLIDHPENSQQPELPIDDPENTSRAPSSPTTNTNPFFAQLPPFLTPGPLHQHLEILRGELNEPRSNDGYVSLLPDHITRRLIENSLDEIWPSHLVVINRSDLMTLFDRKYVGNSTGPGSDPASWALINAVIALAIRAKTVDTPTMPLSNIASAYYRNATRVLDQLVLGSPSMLSVQALLTMAIAARVETGLMAARMLVINAGQLLCMLRLQSQDTNGDDLGMLEYLQNVANRMLQESAMELRG